MAIKYLALASIVSPLFLVGCSAPVHDYFGEKIVEPNYANMYLVGNFTWWETDEKYHLRAANNYVYNASVRLIADGQPYEFKFIDPGWNAGSNCGYASETEDKIIELGRNYRANCFAGFENFQFTPSETGLYQFNIDFSSLNSPRVFIQRMP